MSDAPKYTMVIFWSAEDEAYLVSLPDWDGIVINPVIHGDSYDEAVRHGREVIEGLILSLTADGEPLPEPRPILTAA